MIQIEPSGILLGWTLQSGRSSRLGRPVAWSDVGRAVAVLLILGMRGWIASAQSATVEPQTATPEPKPTPQPTPAPATAMPLEPLGFSGAPDLAGPADNDFLPVPDRWRSPP